MRDLVSTLTRAARTVVQPRNAAPVPYTSTRSSLFDRSSGTGPPEIGEAAFLAYGSVGTLFAIVTQLNNAFCSVDWHLFRRTSVRDISKRQEVMTHAFLTVWQRPNPFYSNRMLKAAVQQHLDLVGEGYIILNRVGSVVTEMWCVRPDRMQPVKHPTKFLIGWVYQGPDGEEVPLEVQDVIQLKYPNPGDPYRGMGPVQTVMADIDASRYSAEWNRNFFINGARPGGVIEVDYRMNDDEWQQFLARWRSQHQGVANAHRVAVLENAKWVDTKFTMQDMQFEQLRNLPREIIREAFAFPKPMLGTVDDVNRANAQAGKEILAENQTLPRLEVWKDTINTFLLPQFANGAQLILDHDNPVPTNSEDADRERKSQTQGVFWLCQSGFDGPSAAEAMGLPEMVWNGLPTAAPATMPNENDGQSADQANNFFAH
jgi:HK97 family phage portal protein